MFIGDAFDHNVGETIFADRAVEHDVGIGYVDGIVIEVGMGRRDDVDFDLRQISTIPVPFARRMIAPRIDHDRETRR